MNAWLNVLLVAKILHQWLSCCESNYKGSKNDACAGQEYIHGIARLAHRRIEVTIQQQCQQTNTYIHQHNTDMRYHHELHRSGINMALHRLSSSCLMVIDHTSQIWIISMLDFMRWSQNHSKSILSILRCSQSNVSAVFCCVLCLELFPATHFSATGFLSFNKFMWDEWLRL